MRDLSIVVPVYNGAKTVPRVVEESIRELGDVLLEIVLVNDGSSDESRVVCRELVSRFRPTVKYVELARNFSEHNAVMAGLQCSGGAFVAIMDDDCQNPPSEVRKLLDELAKGYDVVYSYYAVKRHGFWRNLGSRFNDLVARFMLNKPRDLYLSSFKAMNRFLVDQLAVYTNPYPYLDGLILQTTSNIGKVRVEHHAREVGRSQYTFRKLVALWSNMATNFSIFPLRIAAYVGFFFALCGFGVGMFVLWEKLNHPNLPIGYASIVVSVLVIGGVQCFMLGMLGEYLGRLFLTVNRRPQYVIRYREGWDPK